MWGIKHSGMRCSSRDSPMLVPEYMWHTACTWYKAECAMHFRLPWANHPSLVSIDHILPPKTQQSHTEPPRHGNARYRVPCRLLWPRCERNKAHARTHARTNARTHARSLCARTHVMCVVGVCCFAQTFAFTCAYACVCGWQWCYGDLRERGWNGRHESSRG